MICRVGFPHSFQWIIVTRGINTWKQKCPGKSSSSYWSHHTGGKGEWGQQTAWYKSEVKGSKI